MPDIHIERNHTLGIAGAREVARQWVQQAEQEFGLECAYTEGKDRDTAQFTRAGIDGTVEVTASTFTLDATLGFLFSSFSDQIEQKITRNLDALLDAPQGGSRFA
ncbi:polyhydroxyalkanoic acid system family protein [Variovorax sp. PAMC26660]|uniref:polyhydroxyalkanoic acid system family protein n=1 Tax=Variovorax sp. PAMC26660 TaxID=2762322 RepID=UPI00164EBEFF|nr:polyhydroxyalkanoic acid system family protein [Variovorax sp. PAMC26660]QNK70701.1 polyhydroxyalkanoic acid system family protein [Variovorax sp. PAMC26660]